MSDDLIKKEDLFNVIKHGNSWFNGRIKEELKKIIAEKHSAFYLSHSFRWDSDDEYYYIYDNECYLFIFEGKIEVDIFTIKKMPIVELPDQIKQQVRSKLLANNPSWQITSILDFMDMPLSNQPQLWTKFLESTKKLDLLRQQDLAETFPELWQLIKQQ